jgi:hypothetical protein
MRAERCEERVSALWQTGAFLVVAVERRARELLRLYAEHEIDPADMAAIAFALTRLRFRLHVVNDGPAIRTTPCHWHRRAPRLSTIEEGIPIGRIP